MCTPGASRTAVAQAKARQASKIGELKAALTDTGHVVLDEQARALGRSRSTAYSVLKEPTKRQALQRRLSFECSPRRICLHWSGARYSNTNGRAYGHSRSRAHEFSVHVPAAVGWAHWQRNKRCGGGKSGAESIRTIIVAAMPDVLWAPLRTLLCRTSTAP